MVIMVIMVNTELNELKMANMEAREEIENGEARNILQRKKKMCKILIDLENEYRESLNRLEELRGKL